MRKFTRTVPCTHNDWATHVEQLEAAIISANGHMWQDAVEKVELRAEARRLREKMSVLQDRVEELEEEVTRKRKPMVNAFYAGWAFGWEARIENQIMRLEPERDLDFKIYLESVTPTRDPEE